MKKCKGSEIYVGRLCFHGQYNNYKFYCQLVVNVVLKARLSAIDVVVHRHQKVGGSENFIHFARVGLFMLFTNFPLYHHYNSGTKPFDGTAAFSALLFPRVKLVGSGTSIAKPPLCMGKE